ncbi:MAG TPA: hypothetical protein VE867_04810 [Candidatus Binatia bacterium]|nr:hypothetical protein [Candidatus Binatia bacterium]
MTLSHFFLFLPVALLSHKVIAAIHFAALDQKSNEIVTFEELSA